MFKVCRIILENQESINSLKEFFGGYPIEFTTEIIEDFKTPTLIVGWDFVKKNFKGAKIYEKNILENIEWTYSEEECAEIKNENYIKIIEDFVDLNLNNWLPNNFILFDTLIHGDFCKFIEKNIIKECKTYVHFNNGAMYLRNCEKDFIINIKTLAFQNPNYKELISNLINNLDCLLYTYDKVEDYVEFDLIKNVKVLDIIRWVKYGVETPLKYFQIVPGQDIHKFIPFLMSKIHPDSLEMTSNEYSFFTRMQQRDEITRWMSNRYISFSHNFNKNLNFLYREYAKLSKLNYSTKRTITGRITCVDSYNPQNLNKSNDERMNIVSRYRGGKLYQFDYTSFEARIALYLSQDDDFIKHFYDKDLHLETARIIFDKFEVSEKEREVAKLANMAIMYGASQMTVLKMLENFPEPLELFFKIKVFLKPIFDRAEQINKEAKENGYLINKWGSIIRPEKDFAGFNNYLQSIATEIIIDKCFEIRNLLIGKKSQFMFQVHDSLVFDIHPQEQYLVQEIIEVLSYNKGMIFSVNHKSGQNFKELSVEEFYF